MTLFIALIKTSCFISGSTCDITLGNSYAFAYIFDYGTISCLSGTYGYTGGGIFYSKDTFSFLDSSFSFTVTIIFMS